MQGRKVYEFALTNVPIAMKSCFDESKCNIDDLKKIFIHQANKKWMKQLLRDFIDSIKVLHQRMFFQ